MTSFKLNAEKMLCISSLTMLSGKLVSYATPAHQTSVFEMNGVALPLAGRFDWLHAPIQIPVHMGLARLLKSADAWLWFAVVAALVLVSVPLSNVQLSGWLWGVGNDAADGELHARAVEAPVIPRVPAPAGEGPTRQKVRCEECGVIVSMRPSTAPEDAAGSKQITVRLDNRSVRVLSVAATAKWRVGERIILIGGDETPPDSSV